MRAFDKLEREIELRRKEIEVLEGRHRSFVHDAIIEGAEALGAVYVAQIAARRRTIAELLGIATVVEGRRTFFPSFSAEGEAVQAYAPQMQPSIKVTATDADNAAPPWRALVTLWIQDPRAEPPVLSAIDTTDEQCRCLATAARPTTTG